MYIYQFDSSEANGEMQAAELYCSLAATILNKFAGSNKPRRIAFCLPSFVTNSGVDAGYGLVKYPSVRVEKYHNVPNFPIVRPVLDKILDEYISKLDNRETQVLVTSSLGLKICEEVCASKNMNVQIWQYSL